MFASVHADRSGRVLISTDRPAAGMGGTEPIAIEDAVPLPDGGELVTLPREAIAFDRAGRARPLGKGRRAIAAIVPDHRRVLFPAYVDDPAAAALDPRAYAAVAATADGRLVVAATPASRPADHDGGVAALGVLPADPVARQLARCSRESGCAAARVGLGSGVLPIPLGAPSAERTVLQVDLRSGYAAVRVEPASFRPTARDVVAIAAAHLERGGAGVSFGRACDGEPLARIRVLEEAAERIRARSPRAAIRLETTGSDAAALRRAIDAGVSAVTIRIASARADTYERVHGPLAHRWSDVRASLLAAGERRIALTVALLVLPGLTDRAAEIDALGALLGELPGGRLELRDLGADPLRVLAAVPRAPALGVGALLARIAEADHFRTGVA